MKLRHLGAVLALLLVAGLPGRLYAQGGVVRGVATDTAGAPLAGIQVVLEGSTRRAMTRADGRFEFRGISPGSRTVRARGIGYTEVSRTFDLGPGDAVDLTLALIRLPIEVASLTVFGSGARPT